MSTEEKDTETVSVWTYTENAPAYAGAIAYLWGWSLNYDRENAPFPLFLDLVGYSQDRWGSKCSVWGTTETNGLGWLELDLLAKALIEYADNPHDCDRWLDGLHDCEAHD